MSSVVSLVELGKQLLRHVELGDIETTRELMAKGAPFATDCFGRSPLHIAAENGNIKLVELLVQAGISKEAKNKVEMTPLISATVAGHDEVARLLLESGVDVNAIDMLGNTCLHYAAKRGNESLAEFFLEHGANPALRNKFLKKPREIAQKASFFNVATLLENAGVSEFEPALAAQVQEIIEITGEINRLSNDASTNVNENACLKDSLPSTSNDEHETMNAAFNIPCQPDGAETNNVLAFKTLEEHGIAMLQTDNSTVVETAVANGQTVALTEAGKLAFSLTQPIAANPVQIVKRVPIVVNKTNGTVGAQKLFSINPADWAKLLESSGTKTKGNTIVISAPTPRPVKRKIVAAPNPKKIKVETISRVQSVNIDQFRSQQKLRDARVVQTAAVAARPACGKEDYDKKIEEYRQKTERLEMELKRKEQIIASLQKDQSRSQQ